MKRIAITLALGAALLAPALAQVDAAKSSVIAVSKQMGVPVEGKFRRFSAQVSFDPAKPADGRASIEIDIASFDLGDADFNRETAKKEWFDAAKFPRATFVTTAIRPAGAGKFEAAGKLTIKGKTLDEAAQIKNSEIAEELALPPVKIHCSVLAEDAIKAAIHDLKQKREC